MKRVDWMPWWVVLGLWWVQERELPKVLKFDAEARLKEIEWLQRAILAKPRGWLSRQLVKWINRWAEKEREKVYSWRSAGVAIHGILPAGDDLQEVLEKVKRKGDDEE